MPDSLRRLAGIKKVYLAGPMRGLPNFNFPAFDSGAAQLRAVGYHVFSPAERDRMVYGSGVADSPTGDEYEVAEREGFSVREALADDTQWIAKYADAVVVLPGWRESTGALAETALATAIHVPILSLDEVICGVYSDEGIKVGPFDWECPPNCEEDIVDGFGTLVQHLIKPDTERMTESATGGLKAMKLARHDLIPAEALTALAEHYGRTAQKYPPNNWRQGFEWSKSYAALQRHVIAWWNGEDVDPELGSSHLAAVMWHCATLLTFLDTHPEFDDRVNKPVLGDVAIFREYVKTLGLPGFD